MRTRRWRIGGVVAALLLATACGGGASDSSGDDVQVKAVGLEDAFATASQATSFRMTQSNGQTISSSALGVDSQTEIDEDHPTITAEITPDATHISVDLSALLGPLMGDDAASVGFEMWTDPDRLVLDSRGYAGIKEANPDADLGPFEPGVSFIDLAAAGAKSPDLLAAVVGQGLPDLREMAKRLPEVLEDVHQIGTSYTGTASYADLIGAMGTDIDQVARSSAAAVAVNLDVDVDAIVDLYVGYFEDTAADVTIEIGSSGVVQSVRYEVDISGIYDRVFESADELGLDASDAELQDAQQAFADTVWTLDSLIRFEVVDDLEVEPAPETTDDRTDEWLAFLSDAGF